MQSQHIEISPSTQTLENTYECNKRTKVKLGFLKEICSHKNLNKDRITCKMLEPRFFIHHQFGSKHLNFLPMNNVHNSAPMKQQISVFKSLKRFELVFSLAGLFQVTYGEIIILWQQLYKKLLYSYTKLYFRIVISMLFYNFIKVIYL